MRLFQSFNEWLSTFFLCVHRPSNDVKSVRRTLLGTRRKTLDYLESCTNIALFILLFFPLSNSIPRPETQIKKAKRVERDAKEVAAAKKARKAVSIETWFHLFPSFFFWKFAWILFHLWWKFCLLYRLALAMLSVITPSFGWEITNAMLMRTKIMLTNKD